MYGILALKQVSSNLCYVFKGIMIWLHLPKWVAEIIKVSDTLALNGFISHSLKNIIAFFDHKSSKRASQEFHFSKGFSILHP